MKNILFRADSSSIIGTGHIMRDLVLAEQYKDANIIFATQNLAGNINHKIKEKNYTIKILKTNDINELIDIIKKNSIGMIIIDHYNINYEFERTLKKFVTKLKIFVIDDTYEKHYCDTLLNHNINANFKQYRGLVPENCEIKCGVKYILLRDEFKKIKKAKRDISLKDKITVFIAMGGSDHSNKNISILEVINKFNNIEVNIVTTKSNKYLQELENYIEKQKNITIYLDTDKIALLMNKSDFAIVTPSVVVNEVLFMKLPFIAIQTAENQHEIAQYLKQHNLPILYSYEENTLFCEIKKLINIEQYNNLVINIDSLFKENKD